MSKLKLTQYLYNEEEVKLSFIYSILTKQDIREVYYWLFELYYSNEEWIQFTPDQSDVYSVFNLIWKLYYDYYYSLNPKFESYIRKKQILWEINKRENENKSDIKNQKIEEPIFYILKNMYMLNHNCELFMIRQIYSFMDLCQTHMVRFKRKGRPPSYLKDYDKQYHDLFYWIMNKKWINICYYLKRILFHESIGDNTNSNAYNVYKEIVKFCVHDVKVGSSENEKETLYEMHMNDWNVNKYSDVNHFILKTIYNFICIESLNNINNTNKRVYVCPQNEDIDFTINHMTRLTDIPTNKQGEKLSYKILSYKRSYPLYDEIGSFKLERFNVSHSEYKNLHYYNWEYYASRSPIWARRISKYNGKFCNETNRLLFENDSDLENFYELYGYEFDEQSLQVQELSLLEIKKISSINWIDSIYSSIHNSCKFYKEDNDILNMFKEIQHLVI